MTSLPAGLPQPGVSTPGSLSTNPVKGSINPSTEGSRPARPRRAEVLRPGLVGDSDASSYPSEVVVPARKTAPPKGRSFTSVDGTTYSIPTRKKDGSPREDRVLISLFLAVRELELGGKASTVFDAMDVQITDSSGRQLLPISESSRASASPSLSVHSDDDHSDDDQSFALGT